MYKKTLLKTKVLQGEETKKIAILELRKDLSTSRWRKKERILFKNLKKDLKVSIRGKRQDLKLVL